MHLSLFLFLFSLGSLVFAYISEYGFGLLPCILCIYQRIPFMLVAVLSGFSMLVSGATRIALVAICGVVLLVGAGIAFYHVGVEYGKFEMTEECGDSLDMSNIESIEDLEASLIGKEHVPCDKPQFVFLGVSMAGWNFLFSGFVGLLTLIMSYRIFKGRHV